MTQIERDNILLKIYENQEQMRKDQEEMRKEQEQMRKDQEKMRKDQEEMKKEISKIPQMQEEIRDISRSVAVIEHVHGEKIQILLDVVTGHIKKFEEVDARLTKCENKIETCMSEIFYLKEKVQGL